ncbi:DUF1822 family protein [Rivularia sp. UHCC 0363]|uniref:DUF1822 family protein n=1 Tax=Rivularia sp. UHCC 0363 TaxID=3110244 RepID=UPI002B20128E|nr:DUF1822 family protein [Rivularia sp. UHCC 0363]MEA5594919.1 DUF1822 family protein [Rivularia sp. UHCC 0363]
MNKLCLLAILPWLESEFAQQAKLSPSTTALPSLWEPVNGCSIMIRDATKFVLVPSIIFYYQLAITHYLT